MGCRMNDTTPAREAERATIGAALLDHRDRLRGRQPSRPDPRHLAQWRWQWGDGAEVGTGADHDLDAGLAQRAHGLGEVAHRDGRQHRVGDVVGADEDHCEVGLGAQRLPHLDEQLAGLRAHDGVLTQVDPSVGALGHQGGEPGAGGLLDRAHAVARGAGVAQERQAQRGAWPAAAVPARGVGHPRVGGADGAPGDAGLGPQQGIGQQAQPAAPEHGGGRLAPRCPHLPHGPILRSPQSCRWARPRMRGWSPILVRAG